MKGGEGVERRESYKELRETLLEFVKQASKKGATPVEIAALPEVARVLKEMLS